MVLGLGQGSRLGGMSEDGRDVAGCLREGSPIDRDRGGNESELRAPLCLEPGRQGGQVGDASRDGCVLGRAEPRVHLWDLAGHEVRPGSGRGQQRAPTHHVLRQRPDQVDDRLVPPLPPQYRDGRLDEVCGERFVARLSGVPGRLGEETLGRVPRRCAPVQVGDVVRGLGPQPHPQRVGEEVVVAEPPPVVVEGDDEEVPAFERREGQRSVGATGDRVAQGTGQSFEHARAEEEAPCVAVDGGQHLVDEVVQDEPVAPTEVLDEGIESRRRSGPPPRRECSELQSGRPALGPGLQSVHVVLVQRQVHDLGEEAVCLGAGEPQVGGTDLEQLAPRAEARQRQLRVCSGGHDQCGPRRQMVDEEAERLLTLDGVGEVPVIQRDDERPGMLVDLGDETREERLGVGSGIAVDGGSGAWAHSALGGMGDCGHEIRDEVPGLDVVGVHGQPRDGRLIRAAPEEGEPLDQQRGLAESRWGGKEDQPRKPARVAREGVDEPLPLQQRPTPGEGSGTGRLGLACTQRLGGSGGGPRCEVDPDRAAASD